MRGQATGRPQLDRDSPAHRETAPGHELSVSTAFLHTVIDDHSLVAYVEICADEKAIAAIGALERVVAWFTDLGVTVEWVLSDNGTAYMSHAGRDACAGLCIRHKRNRPYRRQTNGKIERFHRALADGSAYARYPSVVGLHPVAGASLTISTR